MTRTCYRCEKERSVEEFARDKSKGSGRKSICRECDNYKSRRYYEANRDTVLARSIAYQAEVRKNLPRVRENTRVCANCRLDVTVSPRHRYCEACRSRMKIRKRYEKGSSTQQGYGAEHRRLRLEWAREVDAGGVACWRCGNLITPGALWDLGHVDGDKSRYMGPEHQACSRKSGGELRAGRVPVVIGGSSRAW